MSLGENNNEDGTYDDPEPTVKVISGSHLFGAKIMGIQKLYKLTNYKDQTYHKCQWGENVEHETSGKGNLCGVGFTHWYLSPELAVLLNPIHGNFDLKTAHLWEGEGEIVLTDHELKVGCKKAKTLRRVRSS